MKARSLQHVAYGQPMDMGGFPIRQSLPSKFADQLDPFLLLHHANLELSKELDLKTAGVGAHPHRGFSPVTFIFQGGVHHRDSRGNSHVVYEGGTQWMNAGMGIIHSERPPADIQDLGGRQELIQLWINTPAKYKMEAPRYMPLSKEETPVVISSDQLTRIQVIAGALDGIKGPIVPQSPINMFTVQMKKGATYFIPFETSHNAFVYVLKGRMGKTEEELVPQFHLAAYHQDGTGIQLDAIEDSLLLVGTGEPLNEPVVAHGPFVMNTETEIMEAFRDYRKGKMGVLIEE